MKQSIITTESVVGGLLGESVGDAFGVPVEFLSRAQVRELDIREMVGNDCGLTFRSRWSDLIPRGAWSDDTSMTIAAMASIIERGGEIDWDDIMKRFLDWWQGGRYTSLEFPFGLGTNISYALDRFTAGTPALDCGGKGFMDNGNGALMRMFPFSVYCIARDLDDEKTLDLIRKAAGITHGHEINALSCYIYTLFLAECIRTGDPGRAYRRAVRDREAEFGRLFSPETIRAHEAVLQQVAGSDFAPDSVPENGYVVTSLTAALYSILRTDSFEDAILTAVAFGYDTDTNAAIAGSVAGALYGAEGIPERWLGALRKKDELIRIGENFAKAIGA